MRAEGWEQRLDEWVERHRTLPHLWGQTDCAMFASGAAQAVAGVDPFGPFRGQYETEEQAEQILDDAGGFEALCTALLGEPVGIALARRGDLLFGPLRRDGAEGLAVCLGAIAVSPGYNWRPIVEATEDGLRRHTGRIVAQPGLVFHKLGGFRLAYRID